MVARQYLSPSGALKEAAQAVAALMSELGVHWTISRKPANTFHIDPASSCLLRAVGAQTEAVLTIPGRPLAAVKTLADKLGADLPKECALEFSASLAVTHHMTLPAESRDILEAIVRNKIEGLAPWPLWQCVFGMRTRSLAGDPDHVRVDVAVVSRIMVDEVAAALVAAGSAVKAVRIKLVDGDELQLAFGAEKEAGQAQRWARRFALGIAAVSGVTAICGLLLVWQASHELAQDREKTATLLSGLRNADLVQSRTTRLGAAEQLHDQRRHRAPAIAVLDELSQLLPQGVWLERLSIEDSLVTLRGQGTDIPSLIAILERSGTFRDVNFAAATQFNAELNSNAFSIEATLEPNDSGGTVQ